MSTHIKMWEIISKTTTASHAVEFDTIKKTVFEKIWGKMTDGLFAPTKRIESVVSFIFVSTIHTYNLCGFCLGFI